MKGLSKEAQGWRYLILTLFKDLNRAAGLFPFLTLVLANRIDCNNIVEAWHNVLKHCTLYVLSL